VYNQFSSREYSYIPLKHRKTLVSYPRQTCNRMAHLKKWEDLLVTSHEDGKVCRIMFNRPKSLNAFGGIMMAEFTEAVHMASNDSQVVIIIVTGNGRFFSSGADVTSTGRDEAPDASTPDRMRSYHMSRLMPSMEMMRALIESPKVILVAMNGSAVGGGAAWTQAVADLMLVADNAWLQVTFNSLGLIPELGAGQLWPASMGLRRSNEALLFGRKLTAKDLLDYGFANHILPANGFQDAVLHYCHDQLKVNNAGSILASKALISTPAQREERMLAIYKSTLALAERFVTGEPQAAFERKRQELAKKSHI
jgi:peroxisomal 3,2-trans-enoyl-CoA isomerase